MIAIRATLVAGAVVVCAGVCLASHCNQPIDPPVATLQPCAGWQTHVGNTQGTPNGEHNFTLAAQAGTTYVFTFCQGGGSASWDTGLSVWNGASMQICNDDTCGLQSEITWVCGSTGTYTVRIGGFGGATGPYTLAYDQNQPCQGIDVADGGSVPWTGPSDATGVVALAFSLSAQGVAHTVTGLSLDASGTGLDDVDLLDVHVYEDADGSATLTAPDVLLVSAGAGYPADDGQLVLAIPAINIPGGGSFDGLVVYDLSGSGLGGTDFVAAVSALAVSSPANATVNGLPLAGPALTIEDTVVAVTPGAQHPISPVGASNGAADVILGQVALDTAGSPCDAVLDHLDLHASGTGNDATGVVSVDLYLDDPGGTMGLLDPQDSLVGSGTFPADDGTASVVLGTPLRVGRGTVETLLVTYTFGPAAGANPPLTYTCTLAGPADVGLLGGPPQVTFPAGPVAATAEVTECPVTVCGDCDGDNVVTIVDALLAAQHGAQLITLTLPALENCNVEGAVFPDPARVVNVLDALILAQWAANLQVLLACC